MQAWKGSDERFKCKDSTTYLKSELNRATTGLDFLFRLIRGFFAVVIGVTLVIDECADPFMEILSIMSSRGRVEKNNTSG